MPLLFHQNMRTFGGGAAARNAAYSTALTSINQSTGSNYLVAGFTEITNFNGPLQTTLSGLAQTLDPGLKSQVVIEVGTTALGMREFIGIAWDRGYVTAEHVGQVLWSPVTKAWRAYDTPIAVPPVTRVPLPQGVALGADTRGLAYVAAITNNQPAVFAFMHNMYALGNKSGEFSSLNVMCSRLQLALQDQAYGTNTLFYLGGDFNLEPRIPNRRGGNFPLVPLAERAPNGNYYNTTYSHTYDYWVVSDRTLTDTEVDVRTETRRALCSDHAGVILTN